MVLAILATLIVAAPSAAQGPTSPPGAPTGVTASAGTLSGTVHWTPSGSAADSYTVTSNPGGITATIDGTATSATVTGLGYLTSYSFSVTGTNSLGTGPPSTPSNAVTPDPPGGPYHQGLAIVLLNQDVSAGNPLATNLGDDPVHLPGLTAVVVNLTASQATVATSVQIVVNQQVVATISVAPGQVQSSLVVVAVPAKLSQAAIQVTAGRAHVQLDFVGYFTGPKTLRNHSGLLEMITPATLLDASVAAGSTTNVPMLGQGGIPAAHVADVLLNVTATNAAGSGAFMLRPTGGFAFGVTTLGFAAGQTTANRAIVAVPNNGSISVVDRGAAATIHIDVLGWFTDGTDPAALGALYNPLAPTRLVDTTASGGPLAAGATLNFPVYGQGGAPPVTASAPPTSAMVQITAVTPVGAGSISVAGAMVVDFAAGQTASRLAIVHLASDGSVTLGVSGSATNVTIDLVGYFAGDLIVPGSTKVLTPALLAAITAIGDASAPSDSVTFAPGTQVSAFIQLNDVIAAGISPTTPQGFLLRVLNVRKQPDGSVVLGTRVALLSEALTAFTIDWVAAPTAGRFGPKLSGAPAGAAASAVVASANPFPPPPNTSIDDRYPKLRLGDIVALANAVGTGTLPQLNSDGSLHLFPVPWADLALTDLEIQVLPHFHIEYNFFNNTAKAAFAFSAGVKLALELSVTKDLLSAGAVTPSFTFEVSPPFDILIGPVPVSITPTMTLVLTLDATVSVGVKLAYHYDKFSQVTESYDGSQFQTSTLDKTYVNGFDAPEFEGNAEAKLALHAGPGLTFYRFCPVKILGIAVCINPFTAGVDYNRFLKVSATVTCTLQPSCSANPWWTQSSGQCIGVFMKLDLIVFNKYFQRDLACIEQVLSQAPGPHLDVTVTPPAATVPRFQTQHFQAGVAASSHGVIWSVEGSSGAGALSNSTATDTDYTAPGVPGTYKVKATAIDDPTSFGEATITVPAAVPSSPTGVNAVAGATSALVNWSPPSDSGGVPITAYHVVVSPGGAQVDTGNVLSATVPNLTPGSTYTFTVTATNNAGLTSAPSAASAPVTIPNPIPDQVIVTPQNTDFGLVAAGQSMTQTLTVHASSTADITITSLLLQTGLGLPLDFAVPASTDNCTGTTVPAGGTCTFQVVYAAAAEGYSFVVVYVYYNTPTMVVSAFLHGHAPLPVVSGFNSVTDAQMLDLQHGWAMDGTRGMWSTSDGATWTRQVAPAGASFQYNFRFADAMHGLALGCAATGPGLCTGFDAAILGTSDGGATWSTLSSIPSLESRGIWFDKDGIHAWTIGADIHSNAAMYASGDGGLSWVRQTLPDPEASSCIAAGNSLSSDISSVRFIDHLNGWAFGSSECQESGTLAVLSQLTLAWSTADGGATWTAHDTGLNTFFIFPSSRLQVLSPGSFRIAIQVGTAPPAILATDDGGLTFRQIPLPDAASDLSYLDSNNAILMTGTNGRTTTVWTSTNDGVTWTKTPTLLPGLIRTLSNNVVDFYNRLETVDATHWWAFGRIAYLDGSPVAGVIEASADASTSWRTQLVGDLTP
jgi:hypothetical protein